MKIYTRTGDDGSTGLYGGQRTGKDDVRVDAYGTIDELNAILGVALANCFHDPIRDILVGMQSRLFDLGADLCTPTEETKVKKVVRIREDHVLEIEAQIDRVSESLGPIKYFILPGGGALAAHLHHARTVARRAERLIVALSRHVTLGEFVLAYVNRLNDLLFALARWANHLDDIPDVPWQAEGESPSG